MGLKLQVKTKYEQQDAEQVPVSPTAQYFNSKSLSVSNLAVMESEVPIDDSSAMELLQNVFLPINPRFSSIMVSDNKGVQCWKRVEVNLQDHLHVPTFPDGLSLKSYDEYFDNYLTKVSMDPLPQDRPLWAIHITKYPTSKAAGHLIFKIHQSLGDGFSLMGALLSCMQRSDNPSVPLTFPSLQPSSGANRTTMEVISCVPRTLSAICNTVYDYGWSVLKGSFIDDDKTPIRSGDRAVESRTVTISTVALSLDKIKQIKMKLGVTINDILTGIVFLGTRLYMQETGAEFGNSKSTAMVLLRTRNISGYKSVQDMVKADSKAKWGNQIALLHVALPKLTPDKASNPLQFVFAAQRIIKRKRNSLTVHLTGQSIEILRKLRGPEVAAQYIYRTLRKSSMAISNMIGPVEQMSLANHPCKGLYFMAVNVPQSLTITVLSYMRTLRIAIGAEKGFIDSLKLNSCIENAFELISKEALEASNDMGRQTTEI